MQILDNGCIISNFVFPSRVILDNKDTYELQRKCGNKKCVNKAHVSYKLTHDQGLKITTEPHTESRKLYGAVQSKFMAAQARRKKIAVEEKKIYLGKLKNNKSKLWREYQEGKSFRDLQFKYGASTFFFRQLFKGLF